ncbi:MAG: polysaccharide deacetylase family protein, partial [Vicinamibacterales bacterium]
WTFELLVRWLATGVVRVTSLEHIAAMSDDADAVALTFDDAFESVATIAAPLLRDHGLTATVFAVTDHVGATNAWGGRSWPGIPVMSLLDWGSLAGLVEGGLTLGAHSRTHPDLTAIDPGQARDEIAGSVERLHHETGVRPSCFAYPYGRANSAIAEITASVCDQAYTAELRPLGSTDSRFLLPRLDAYYFQAGGRLESWGRARWHAYVQCRSLFRHLRQAVTQ